MPIYTDSKGPPGGMGPPNASASVWSRLEPLITPDQLKSRFLKGIPLTLKIKDPSTGKPFMITDEELKDYIDRALDFAEQETGLYFMPTKFSEKLPFQRQDWESLGYFQLPRRPISSIDSLTVRLADGGDVFVFPNEWIETANLIWGQINLIPLAFQAAGTGTGLVGGSGSTVFFNSLWNRQWVAALFGVEYTVGFPDGMVPKTVNELVGTIAAMRTLSQLGAAQAGQNSVSISLDGQSQSVSGPGPDRYRTRMEELGNDRKMLVKKLKKTFGTNFVVGTV